MRYSFIILLFGLFAIACGKPNEKVSKKPKSVLTFFDLKGYFEKEIKRLEGKKDLTKVAAINGQKQEQKVASINFEEELLIFSNADINKTAWSDKYSVDSTFNEQKVLEKIKYLALIENLKTRSLEINFEENQISKIEIHTLGKSPISLAKKHLIYEPKVGYSILSNQDVSLASDNELFVKVLF